MPTKDKTKAKTKAASKAKPKSKAASKQKAAVKAKAPAKTKAGRKSTGASAKARGAGAAKRTAKVRSGTTAAVAPSGPVTLEQARALAQAKSPKRALRRAMAGPEPLIEKEFGDNRDELRQQQEDVREQRKREYRDTIRIMKQRGAKAPPAKAEVPGRRRAVSLTPKTFDPLQAFAEGDSWFDYPVPFFGGGIIPRLESRLGVPILNLAKAGDEVRFMLGVEQRKRLIQTFKEGPPAGGAWDLMLFSGGGNDIVDNPMALWIRDWDPNAKPADLINQPRFAAALALVRAGYEDLVSLRDKHSPGTHIVLHGYDFAIPDGRGLCSFGPWLEPTFKLRGFPTQDAGFKVMKEMLTQFAAILTALKSAHPKVTFVNTQGTLPPTVKSWHNELHPDKDGFKLITGKIEQTVRVLFPDRVAPSN